jgi:hypothetical protein
MLNSGMWKQNTFLHETSIRTSWEQELFYSKIYPPNTTVEWVDTDTPKDAIYEKDIKYTFNEYGFRSDNFEDRSEINIMTCGCSHTVGVGVNQREGWPFVLKNLVKQYTNKTVSVWNLATSGASADYVARSVHKTVNILKPDFICVFWPPVGRVEMPSNENDKNVTQSFLRDDNFPKNFVNEYWLQDYLFHKNLVFMETLANNNNSVFVANTVIESLVDDIEGDYFPADSTARDGLHPGPVWHKTGAEFYFNNIKEHL